LQSYEALARQLTIAVSDFLYRRTRVTLNTDGRAEPSPRPLPMGDPHGVGRRHATDRGDLAPAIDFTGGWEKQRLLQIADRLRVIRQDLVTGTT
jgi:hypothetical protein